jgi:hypothetical protein
MLKVTEHKKKKEMKASLSLNAGLYIFNKKKIDSNART